MQSKHPAIPVRHGCLPPGCEHSALLSETSFQPTPPPPLPPSRLHRFHGLRILGPFLCVVCSLLCFPHLQSSLSAGAACPSTTYTCKADTAGHGAWLQEGTDHLFEEGGKGAREGTQQPPLVISLPLLPQVKEPGVNHQPRVKTLSPNFVKHF